MKKPHAILLMGPTAAGKTQLAIELVKRLPVEIISVDSAMVYRGFDIGTGKPTKQELNIAPHHLIDIKDPQEPYSAAEFCQDAQHLMHEITERNRIPLLAGGTMLYFKALLEGLSPLPSAHPNVREKLLEEANLDGWQAMHARLAKVDPLSAARIHPNDPQRIQRALEVFEVTGLPLSSFFAQTNSQNNSQTQIGNISQYNILSFSLAPPTRAELHQRIEKRFDKMLQLGLIEEVQTIFAQCNISANANTTFNLNLPALRLVGYRQVIEFLQHQYSFDEMRQRAIYATRQLAKRQFTWLRNLQNSCHINQHINLSWSLDENNLLDLVNTMIQSIDMS